MKNEKKIFSNLLFLPLILLLPFKAYSSNLLSDFIPRHPEKTYQQRTVGSGPRCFCKTDFVPNSLTFLVPEEKIVYHTSLDNPPLYFYSQIASTTPLIFTLVDFYQPEPLVEKTLIVGQPGLHKIQLPSTIKLEYGKTYGWQLGIPCTNSNNFHTVLSVRMKKVVVWPRAARQLESTNSLSEKAKIYAEEGIWYEALDLTLKAKNESENYLAQLLESLSIEQIEPIQPPGSETSHNFPSCS